MTYFQPQPVLSGTDAMNLALHDEVDKGQRNLIDMAKMELAKQDPTLNYVQRQLAQGLLGAKQDWENAYKAGDAQGMANAAMRGEKLRGQANSIGWNGNGYGADVSLLEAAQNLANNDTRAVNDILYNLKDSNSIYRQRVADYLDKGYSIDSAKRLAGQRSEEAMAGNIDQLRDAFRMYGQDARGAITPQGTDILASLAQQGGATPSELANFYAQMQAHPKDTWNFENDMLRAANAQANALERMGVSHQYGVEDQERGFAHQEHMARLQNDLTLQRIAEQARMNIEAGIMSKEMGYNWTVNKMIEAGVPQEQALQIAASALIGGGRGGNGGKGATSEFNSKMVEALQKERESVMAAIEEAKASGDEAKVKALQQRAAMLESRIDAFLLGQQDSGAPQVDVNDYDSLGKAFQSLINENAARPWDKQRTRAELEDIFLSKVGRDNPMAIKIVNEADYDGPSKASAQQPTQTASEPPKQAAQPTQPASNTTYTGQQIVAPKNAMQQLVQQMSMVPVYDQNGKLLRYIRGNEITGNMAINTDPDGKMYVIE